MVPTKRHSWRTIRNQIRIILLQQWMYYYMWNRNQNSITTFFYEYQQQIICLSFFKQTFFHKMPWNNKINKRLCSNQILFNIMQFSNYINQAYILDSIDVILCVYHYNILFGSTILFLSIRLYSHNIITHYTVSTIL